MARLYPIYVRRSDGKTEVASSKGGRKEPNQPTAEQMDQKPDKNGVSDYYREVAQDEAKHLEWRRKLGGMLARELQWKSKDSKDESYILVTFPEGFRLYEHVKKSEKDGEVKSRSHQAGSDRQDAYLYGHPSGRRKRFRSPADFFPHLLWLCTDESSDRDNCTCKLCCPDELESVIPGAKLAKEKPVKMDVDAKPVKAISKTETVKEMKPSPKVQPKAAEQPQLNAPEQTQAQPQLLSHDQQLDSQYGSFKYRQGELVWFRRGQAWGLGIITYRHSDYRSLSYAAQALSFPGHNEKPQPIGSENDLRPWLAWSVPRYTHQALNELTPPAMYETADWQGLSTGRYGEGVLDIDASIMAAKSIDSTYTPFTVIGTKKSSPDVVDTFYNGLYLGAEKIWLNEPVRLSTGTDVLVIKALMERTTNGIVGTLQLIGDVYTLANVQHSNPAVPSLASPANNSNLPVRMTEDLTYRNARSIQIRQVAQHWKLAGTDVHCDLQHIKGRWYETSLLLPILQEEAFRQGNESGSLQELGIYLNSRGDCLAANRDRALPTTPRILSRRETRKEALGAAFPPGGLIVEDIQWPVSSADHMFSIAG